MVSFNRNSLEASVGLLEISDANLLSRFDPMSPEQFVKYLCGPVSSEERGLANKYLFGLVDDIDRVNAIIDFAEKSGLLDDTHYE